MVEDKNFEDEDLKDIQDRIRLPMAVRIKIRLLMAAVIMQIITKRSAICAADRRARRDR